MREKDFSKAFGEPGENLDRVYAYLKDVRDNWRGVEESFARTTVTAALLAAVFLLIGDSSASEFSIAGLKVTNVAIVQATIPPVVAYLMYSLMLSANLAIELGSLHDEIIESQWPQMYEQNLELPLRPGQSIGAHALLTNATNRGRLGHLIAQAAKVKLLALIGAPVAFQIFAIAVMWRSSSITSLVAGISTGATVVLLVACIPVSVYFFRELLMVPPLPPGEAASE